MIKGVLLCLRGFSLGRVLGGNVVESSDTGTSSGKRPTRCRLPRKVPPCQLMGWVNSRISEQFRGRRWMNLLPEHLDYNFTQILFIGEKSDITGDIDELEQLEEEDEARVNHLKGNLVFERDGLTN